MPGGWGGRNWRGGRGGGGNYRPWRGRGRGNNNNRGRGRGRGAPPPDDDNFGDNSMDGNSNGANNVIGDENDSENVVNSADANRQFQKRRGKRGGNSGPKPNNQLQDSSSSDDEDATPRNNQRGLPLKHIYPGWSDYFPNTRFKKGCYVEKVMLAFMAYLKQRSDWQKNALDRGFFFVDFEAVTSDPELTADDALGTGFRGAFLENPADTIAAIGLAAHEIVIVEGNVELGLEAKRLAICQGLYPIMPRIVNFGSPMPFRTLRADSYARLAVVCGTVVRMSSVRPTCVELAFKCLGCSNETRIPFSDNSAMSDKTQPTKCRPVDGSPRCTGRTFVACPHSSNTLFIDSRTVRIQEVNNNDDDARDAIPRCIDVELQRELADRCSPGDVVTICGIVRLRPAKETSSNRGPDDSSEFKLYIEANSLKHHSDAAAANSGISSSQQPLDVEQAANNKLAAFSESDLEAFREIKSEPNVFRLLVQSLCPEIYGHELIKAGLVLALFAGRSQENSQSRVVEDSQATTVMSDSASAGDETMVGSHQDTRPNIHVLLVGDPGLGKSQLLRSLSDCAPRVVYVCGSSASVAGLGVAVNRDRSTLQAGALVLADRGICCIDELDKMGGQEAVLLEVMEQQTLSVAKAGFVCSLPARCSIIAAANPSGGRYNHERSVADNIRLPGAGALLSRFDLVFCILDRHDAEHDRMLSEHVIAAYSSSNLNSSRLSASFSSNFETQSSTLTQSGGKALMRRLMPNGEIDLLPHALFRKYVNYAVQTVHPKLSPKAAVLLKNHYLEMRERASAFPDAPITTRQLESMIRLAECRARLDLREDVTEGDARDVIDLMTGTFSDIFASKTCDLVQLRPSGGTTTSRQTIAKRLVPLLQRYCEQNGSNFLSRDDVTVAAGPMRLAGDKLAEAIEILNNQGYLIKQQGGYKLHSSIF